MSADEICRCPTRITIEGENGARVLCLRHGDVTDRCGPVLSKAEALAEAIAAHHSPEERLDLVQALLAGLPPDLPAPHLEAPTLFVVETLRATLSPREQFLVGWTLAAWFPEEGGTPENG